MQRDEKDLLKPITYNLCTMPDVPEFSHKTIEADMQRLAAEVLRHRERPEMKDVSDQEILKASIRSLTGAAPRIEKPVSAVPPASPSSSSPLPAYAEDASAETKLEIEYLLDIVFTKGLDAATEAAKNSNPFVLDAFRDALATKLYPELQKRGLVT